MSKMDEWREEREAYLEGFAANVKRLREEKRFSQADLDRAANLHRTEIGRIESAKIEPRLMTLHILATGLGVTIDELIADLPVPTHRKPSPQEQRKRKGTYPARGVRDDRAGVAADGD
jgi:transcriptional regulator with XRE-family HTH domain